MDNQKALSPLYSGLRNTIPKQRLLGIKTPIPPLDEQIAIDRYLKHIHRRVQRLIQAKLKTIDILAERRKKETVNIIKSSEQNMQRISHVSTIIRREVDRSSQEKFTQIGIFNRGRGIFLKEPLPGKDLGESDFFWIKNGDLVISGQFAWEGSVALASKAEEGCIASHRYPIIRANEDKLDTSFLLAFSNRLWPITTRSPLQRGSRPKPTTQH